MKIISDRFTLYSSCYGRPNLYTFLGHRVLILTRVVVNNAISAKMFPDILKLADVSPIFKMSETCIRGASRPISVLSSLSRLYERVLSQQIVPFMVPNFSNLLCAFRENHSS